MVTTTATADAAMADAALRELRDHVGDADITVGVRDTTMFIDIAGWFERTIDINDDEHRNAIHLTDRCAAAEQLFGSVAATQVFMGIDDRSVLEHGIGADNDALRDLVAAADTVMLTQLAVGHRL
jgi:hypothetical protein